MSQSVFLGAVTTLFLAIIGCYVYVHTTYNTTRERIDKVEDCLEKSLQELTKAMTAFEINVTDRLGRIETGLKHLEKNKRSRKEEEDAV